MNHVYKILTFLRNALLRSMQGFAVATFSFQDYNGKWENTDISLSSVLLILDNILCKCVFSFGKLLL